MIKKHGHIDVIDLGLIDYEKAYERQKKAVSEVIAGARERILLCEHPAVLTLGRMAKVNFILASAEELATKKIKVLPIDRGGEVTLHAPGQLVVYPILDLKRRSPDLHKYLAVLEETAIEFLKDIGIHAERNPGKTGVWLGKKKIASVGVGVKKWVTFHGIGVNISTDLKLFSLIKPCGLDVDMTSVEQMTGQKTSMPKLKDLFIEKFFQVLDAKYAL